MVRKIELTCALATSVLVLQSPGSSGAVPSPVDDLADVLHDLEGRQQPRRQRLAVVLPTQLHKSDYALEIAAWPVVCAPTEASPVDLVVFVDAETKPDLGAFEPFGSEFSRCFEKTKIVLGATYGQIFVDKDVGQQFDEYDAIAVIDWSALMLEDTFEKLYRAAFDPSSPPYWVKATGSRPLDTPETKEGHSASMENLESRGSRRPLAGGDRNLTWTIDGRAMIYNNRDLAFRGFVADGMYPWVSDFSFDVALWATLSEKASRQGLGEAFLRKFVLVEGHYLIAHIEENLSVGPYFYPMFEEGMVEGVDSAAAAANAAARRQSEENPSTWMLFTDTLFRRNLCVFIPGYPHQRQLTEVSVHSVLHFMPDACVTVAAHPSEFAEYQETVGALPGVSVKTSRHSRFSALIADRLCVGGTKLILYLEPGDLLSRSFTRKDTHDRDTGDLLVTYTRVRLADKRHRGYVDAAEALLGLSVPSFTSGADVILPVSANEDLRGFLASQSGLYEPKNDVDESDASEGHTFLWSSYPGVYLPQVLASMAYWMQRPGVSFRKSAASYTDHLFADDPSPVGTTEQVPPKLRFVCNLYRAVAPSDGPDDSDTTMALAIGGDGGGYGHAALELLQQLDLFARGDATCPSGVLRLSTIADDLTPRLGVLESRARVWSAISRRLALVRTGGGF